MTHDWIASGPVINDKHSNFNDSCFLLIMTILAQNVFIQFQISRAFLFCSKDRQLCDRLWKIAWITCVVWAMPVNSQNQLSIFKKGREIWMSVLNVNKRIIIASLVIFKRFFFIPIFPISSGWKQWWYFLGDNANRHHRMRLIGLAFEGRHRHRRGFRGCSSTAGISILGDELAFDVEIGWKSTD